MQFGEIVEPMTRALINDEEEIYPEYTEPQITWNGTADPPASIDTIIFAETTRILQVFKKICLLKELPVASLNGENLSIYKLKNGFYLVECGDLKSLTYNQLVEIMEPWLRKATNIYAITSNSIAQYQNDNLHDKPASILRCLHTPNGPNQFNCEKLESPNLITGFGAGLLSFCLHSGLQCALFVFYLDSSPMDSLNTNQLIDLLNKMKIPIKCRDIKNVDVSSNLYM